jgi:hypothetical protein
MIIVHKLDIVLGKLIILYAEKGLSFVLKLENTMN